MANAHQIRDLITETTTGSVRPAREGSALGRDRQGDRPRRFVREVFGKSRPGHCHVGLAVERKSAMVTSEQELVLETIQVLGIERVCLGALNRGLALQRDGRREWRRPREWEALAGFQRGEWDEISGADGSPCGPACQWQRGFERDRGVHPHNLANPHV